MVPAGRINELSVTFDGKLRLVTGTTLEVKRAFRWLDKNHCERFDTVAGKPTLTRQHTLSDDGRTWTGVYSDTDAHGQVIRHVRVYDRH